VRAAAARWHAQAMPPRMMPKLPVKLVTDPVVGGGLHAVALKVAEIKKARGLKAIEWTNPRMRKEVRACA
jgi:hypothetical protein